MSPPEDLGAGWRASGPVEISADPGDGADRRGQRVGRFETLLRDEGGNHKICGVKVHGLVKNSRVSGHGAYESRPGPKPPPPIDPTLFGTSDP